MTKFKVNDLVTIIKQPNSSEINSHIAMQGLSGYIEEIVGEHAQFQELNEKGYGGCGGVPLSCLQLDNDNPRLQALKKAKEERLERNLKESQERTKRFYALLDKYVAEAQEATHISESHVRTIFEIHQKFVDDWERNQGW